MGDVVESGIVSTIPLSAQKVLRAALDAGMTQCFVVGFDSEGNDYFAGTHSDAGTVLYHFARATHHLMRIIDAETGEVG